MPSIQPAARRPRLNRSATAPNPTVRRERAEEVMNGRMERLGKNYKRTQDGVTIRNVDVFMNRAGKFELHVEAEISPFVTMPKPRAKRIAESILAPLLKDAANIMADEMGIAVPVKMTHDMTRNEIF